MPLEDRRVVGVRERLDARAGKVRLQGGEHGRGEHEVADVVAPDDQELHAAPPFGRRAMPRSMPFRAQKTSAL